MKSIFLPFIFLIYLFTACNKTGTSPANGNGGNGGGGDSLSIAGFSPSNPYTSDVVTLTGTGFNADKAKDSVYFNTPGGTYGRGYVTIISATTTQIKFMMPPDSVSGLLTYGGDGVVDLKISANGKSKYIAQALKFKMTCQVRGVGGGTPPLVRPGDSILITGRGWNLTGDIFSIDGQTFNNVKVDSVANAEGSYSSEWLGFTYLPRLFFGETNNEDASKYVSVSVTNADGKVAQAQVQVGLSPVMKINAINLEGATFASGYGYSYSLSGLNANGGKIRVHVLGKYLKNNTDVEFTGTDANNTVISDVHSSLPVTGFPDSTVIEFGTNGLTPGDTYSIRLWANNSSQGNKFYGFGSFIVKQ